ncbi:DNA topoisomerase (ATP-hydrolyzing) subunit A [Nocardioides sp. zg-1228]|uniref:DNA gyrase/topoisomerase IV subunit A n=1 Tax=Nocardioides sp. zg-1228 TaxID=2763008 RepID=UPI001642FBF4|nr:DNA topoisomerase (ATP-hydrolyzing) [Nocardioides sp. zg-1228]MBC2934484.1 DNA topoisomerase 4 subunit A [Nocardioides sp. zg-1228]QSF59245.1 DNA topoisomerase 4 subunit A [Nocardioides sp. zg-1228]
MARRTKQQPLPDDFEEHILDTDIRDEMQTSFLEYAYSVIYSRALPDARDGLKPVQRRILYTMDEMSLRPDRGHVKSARVVGEVMGRLHPHGDGAIYDALVRMAQPWSMRLRTVDGHGNFGSPDDSPAAMRYTECRMAPAAVAMTASIDEDTVDFKPNYDSREMEPVVLPAAIPHLLVNGSAGIAVGMATNIAPHNLVEVVQALKHLVTHPKAPLDDLMRFIPGPDLPTGGKIVGLDGIRDAYESGRGTFKMRATARIESVTPRRKGIVVTELPYGVGTERVMEQIKKLVMAKKLQGIADIKDLSDREHGLRLVIEIKNGFVPEAILEQLYRQTALEDSFGINAVALVDGQPRTLGLKEMLDVFLGHRFDVVRRRSTFRRAKAADRLHLVDGLLIAILDIDEVIQVIRGSDNAAAAKERLIEIFELSEVQADYILDMPLRRLTRFSRLELEKEKSELERTIEYLDAILADEKLLRKVVSDELTEVAKEHGTPRRTVLLGAAPAVTAATDVEVSDDPCFVLLSSTGLLARTKDAALPGRGGGRTNHDVTVSAVRTTKRGEVGVLTNNGRLVRLSVLDLGNAELPSTANDPNLQGTLSLSELVALEPGERPLALTSLATDGPGLALGTRDGVVKRVNPEVLNRDEWEVIGLKDGDEVVGAVELTTGEEELCFISTDAQLLHFPASVVRPQGRSGGGMAGIKLGAGQHVAFFGAFDSADAVVVTASGSSTALPGTEAGSVKVTPFTEYPGKGRATGGVRSHRFLKGEDTLVTAWAGPGPARAAASSGAPVELPDADGRRDGSGVPASQPIAAVASPVAAQVASRASAHPAADADAGDAPAPVEG